MCLPREAGVACCYEAHGDEHVSELSIDADGWCLAHYPLRVRQHTGQNAARLVPPMASHTWQVATEHCSLSPQRHFSSRLTHSWVTAELV